MVASLDENQTIENLSVRLRDWDFIGHRRLRAFVIGDEEICVVL